MALQTTEIVYSTAETAKLLKLSAGTVAVYVQRGLLVPRRIGNISVFTQSEIERFKESRRPSGNPNFVKASDKKAKPKSRHRKASKSVA